MTRELKVRLKIQWMRGRYHIASIISIWELIIERVPILLLKKMSHMCIFGNEEFVGWVEAPHNHFTARSCAEQQCMMAWEKDEDKEEEKLCELSASVLNDFFGELGHVSGVDLCGHANHSSGKSILWTSISHLGFHFGWIRNPNIVGESTVNLVCLCTLGFSPSNLNDFAAWAPICGGECHIIRSITTVIRWKISDEISEGCGRGAFLICDNFRAFDFISNVSQWESLQFEVVKLRHNSIRDTHTSRHFCNRVKWKIFLFPVIFFSVSLSEPQNKHCCCCSTSTTPPARKGLAQLYFVGI